MAQTTVDEIMTTSVAKTNAETPVPDAAAVMLERDIGSLVIVDGNDSPQAVVTRTDFVEMATNEELITGSPVPNVGELMEEDVLTAEPDASVEEAAAIMEENNVHHLPVVENGELAGIVTTTDLATHVFGE